MMPLTPRVWGSAAERRAELLNQTSITVLGAYVRNALFAFRNIGGSATRHTSFVTFLHPATGLQAGWWFPAPHDFTRPHRYRPVSGSEIPTSPSNWIARGAA